MVTVVTIPVTKTIEDTQNHTWTLLEFADAVFPEAIEASQTWWWCHCRCLNDPCFILCIRCGNQRPILYPQ